ESAETAEAADLAWAAAQGADIAGRPLGAAQREHPRPTAPHLALWQATSVLREHRGDGHIAVLVAGGISPIQAHLIKVGAGEVDDAVLRTARGFPDTDWTAARAQLQDEGLLDAHGKLTERGAAEHDRIEQATDAAAAQPWQRLGRADTERLLALLCPLAKTMMASAALPTPSPVGLAFDPDCRHDAVRSADRPPAATPG
ncbi:MAG TPA: hypothetical protein VFU35_06360, partial [Jatrophihabitans sp.]|nr:hypothetical protein [Jatrophihabitans sp.]